MVSNAVGLAANGYELVRAVQTDYDLIVIFSYMQATYHIGRLGVALGWLGLMLFLSQRAVLQSLAGRLAAVGRMASLIICCTR